MSTITAFTNLSRATVLPATERIVAQEVLDFSLTSCVSGDVVQAINIPAKTLVRSVTLFVETAGTSTVTVGDGDSAAGWQASTSIASSGAKLVDITGAAPFALQGKYYASADTIDVTCAVSQTTAKLRLVAEMVKIEG